MSRPKHLKMEDGRGTHVGTSKEGITPNHGKLAFDTIMCCTQHPAVAGRFSFVFLAPALGVGTAVAAGTRLALRRQPSIN